MKGQTGNVASASKKFGPQKAGGKTQQGTSNVPTMSGGSYVGVSPPAGFGGGDLELKNAEVPVLEEGPKTPPGWFKSWAK